MRIKIFKNLLLNFFIFFTLLLLVISFDNKYTFAFDSFDQNTLTGCSNPYNCILESWNVSNANSSFKELLDILDNTPRIEIINVQEDYVHALATSRVMKYVDDIEIKKSMTDNTLKIKSKSRNGFYDLGVNKRRINTLHFRLIDIYN
tara:strand:- start:147 stop:587 length:441 start_codon:yes stop_codon:yes gene_type:complete